MAKFSKKTFSLYDKYIKEFKKKQKVKADKHYSSYWMDDDWSGKGNTSRFGGWSDDVRVSGAGDIVKLIKLTAYQRAIANFVKIVTNKDIPVVFGGSDSMTNGKQVIIASDISDKNFDVAVGLALHEASHIKLTTFDALKNYLDSGILPWQAQTQFKTIVNIIEDRRIDNYVFKSSPGYRAYYHKMYDHYFYNDKITKALLSADFRDADNWAHWELRLANLTNPMTDLDALPGFRRVYEMIDVKNIGRLKSTEEVIALAKDVFDVIYSTVNDAQMNPDKYKQPDQKTPALGNSEEGTNEDSNEVSEEKNEQMGNSNMSMSGIEGEKSDEDSNTNNDADGDENGESKSMPGQGGNRQHLSDAEKRAVQSAWDKQKKFLNDDVDKKKTTKKLQQDLQNVSKMDLDLQMVGDKMNGFQCIIYDLSSKNYLRALTSLCKEFDAIRDGDPNAAVRRQQVIDQLSTLTNKNLSPNRKYWNMNREMELPSFLSRDNTEDIQSGLELGALLGRKLQVRNEERSLVHNRLMSGHIDAKRLSHAGYGIETVFKQVHIDKYKQVCLHITIDASGSMGGRKWAETVKMTTAIAKAATYVQNLRIQVSARTTAERSRASKDLPVLVYMYDSKHNDFKHFLDVMKVVGPSGCTPEGLCFDAMMRRNILMPSSTECTSYMLNISDGAPGMSGWDCRVGVGYTRKMVQKMKNDLSVNVLSFFVEESHRIKNDGGQPNAEFREMYGKDARLVGSDNVTAIARELNSKFLSEGKYTI
jgi:hypothetical protein